MYKRLLRRIYLLLPMLFYTSMPAQVENVPLNHEVYNFLKLMNVKQVLPSIHDDNPSLARFEVADYLRMIRSNETVLSNTESKLLRRYELEFYPEDQVKQHAFKERPKYLYYGEKDNNNIFIELLNSTTFSSQFSPEKRSAGFFDLGTRIHGTLFKHLAYQVGILKGAVFGSEELAILVFPRLLTTFKFIENHANEDVRSYDFTNGYLKYHASPVHGMHLSFQLGRELIRYGLGYSNSFSLSGNSPPMDFFKLNFRYGVLHFSSIFASTVGEFSFNINERFSKFWAAHRLKLSFPNLFDIGVGESIVYSGRGIELGYLNPMSFMRFVENSLQDRDNGTFFFDLQTHFIKNLQLQGTVFLDENVLFDLGRLNTFINKTAYQVGALAYEPFGLRDLALEFEYSKIRPYVYSHKNTKNSYTAYGVVLGHEIGPNADQVHTNLSYNFNEWLTLRAGYQKVRSGENIVDEDGNLIRNVGGDPLKPYRGGIDSEEVSFLDGIRINSNRILGSIRLETVRDFVFSINYEYHQEKNLTEQTNKNIHYGYLRLSIDY